MPTESVTIVIPCYKQAHFLAEAIESALGQSHRPHEIIVVDDGSPDDTAAIAARYPAVRLLRQANKGLAAARNCGLRASESEFLVFLDADDRLRPEALEVGLRSLRRIPLAAFAYGHVRLIAEDGSPLPTPRQCDVVRDHYVELLRNNYIWTPGAVLYRRAAVEAAGGFQLRVNASADFALNVHLARQFPICCSGEVVLEYRIHTQNMTRNYALMLQAAVKARRALRRTVAAQPQYQSAWRAGIREVQRGYGDPLVDQVGAHWRAGQVVAALRGLLTLSRYHPRGAVKACLPAGALSWLRRLRARRLAAVAR